MKDSRAEGIDAILVDQENFELIFIQAKLVNDYDSTKKNFPENDIKLTLQGIRFLLRGGLQRKHHTSTGEPRRRISRT